MSFVEIDVEGGVATVALQRGKVNAIDPPLVEELSAAFRALERDPAVRAVVLTGRGKFFSFGFDIPEFLGYSREEFTRFVESFTALYRDLFMLPKPLVAAVAGHAIAGGCMLTLPCDRVVMADRGAKISLNEITFGASVFAGSVEMLQFRAGARASEVLYSGAMYAAAEAKELGLVTDVAAPDAVVDRARTIAGELGARRPEAFASLKALLRAPVAEAMERREPASIREFVEIWYSEPTWTNLRAITIR